MSVTVFLRYTAACLLSAGVTSVIAGAYVPVVLIPFAFAIALLHTVVLGLPVYFLLRSRGRGGLLPLMLAGALIGSVPLGLILAVLPTPDFASVDGVPTAVDGVRTAAGWFGILRVLALLAGHGAVGAAVFWLIEDRLGRTPPEIRSANGTRPLHLTLPSAGAILAAGILLVPSIVADRSCHNPLHGGRSSISPEIVATLHVGEEQWPELASLFSDFARTRSWFFREDVSGKPGTLRLLHMSVCSPEGTQIAASGWTSPPEGPGSGKRGMTIAVYQPQGGLTWQEPMQRFLEAMTARWPGQVKIDERSRRSNDPGRWRP